MEVEYTLRPDDFQAFARYHRKLRSAQTHPSLMASLGVLGILIVGIWGGMLFAGLFFQGEGFFTFGMGLLIGCLVSALGQGWWRACMNRSIHKAQCEDPRSEWTIRDIRIILSSDEIRVISRASTSIYEWSRVWHIGETNKHIFLCITRTVAITIPRRAFRDQQHFEEFLALAQQYQKGIAQSQEKSTGIITSLPPESTTISTPDAL